ncbi:MAG: dTDP-4-dehydrorhamnose 3,5-epimerase family protein [Deltaproteobacteria bacterium]|nr:dTDP-4-dehydrorhamnose 3,5-epimerase family protein [Deltaproteobacteria bacterium]
MPTSAAPAPYTAATTSAGSVGASGVQTAPLPRCGTLRRFTDARGDFTELWRQEWLPEAPPFVQANLSRSLAGALRGMHVHLRQDDFQVVLSGVYHVNLVDLRPGMHLARHSLRLEAHQWLHVPAGVAHGLQALEDSLMVYLVSATYDGSDEHGLAWDDPSLALPWPGGPPRLSARDAGAPRLADLRLPGLWPPPAAQ